MTPLDATLASLSYKMLNIALNEHPNRLDHTNSVKIRSLDPYVFEACFEKSNGEWILLNPIKIK